MSKVLFVRLEPNDHATLKEIASLEKRTMASLVRSIISTHLAEREMMGDEAALIHKFAKQWGPRT